MNKDSFKPAFEALFETKDLLVFIEELLKAVFTYVLEK